MQNDLAKSVYYTQKKTTTADLKQADGDKGILFAI